jgi:hypothetical protein
MKNLKIFFIFLLIIILFILTNITVSQRLADKNISLSTPAPSNLGIPEKYENFNNNKKCLLLLYGQSFREGNQGTLTIDTDFSYKTQKLATESHMNFIKYLKEDYDIDTDIIINTYNTKYEDEFKSLYGNNLVLYNKNE